MQKETICVVGLGYVGLPLACFLSKYFTVYGFDINEKKIQALKNGFDETGEVEDLSVYHVSYSSDPAIIREARFIIVAVPTPITDDKLPDLEPLKSASTLIGKNLQKGSVVVYESTVYPGCTEEECLPILQKESGLTFGEDFALGYSPERINPGDKVHTLSTVTKVISASDSTTLDRLDAVYGTITTVFRATSIKVAEAEKVIENVQRSLNIALMNELSLIFDKMGIATRDVLEAAGTKYNFHKYTPGLVGGHCIGVDPYYLTYKAQQLGYEPKVILAGQDVNESMVDLVASKCEGRKNILILGVTFKENVPDIRNSKALEVRRILQEQGTTVSWLDPVLTEKYQNSNFSTAQSIGQPSSLDEKKWDAIIIFSPHDVFKTAAYSLSELRSHCNDNPLLYDIKGLHSRAAVQEAGFIYLTL